MIDCSIKKTFFFLCIYNSELIWVVFSLHSLFLVFLCAKMEVE